MNKPSDQATNIAKNITQIQKNIALFCQTYGRRAEDVQLLAVSKTKPASDIQAAFEAGQAQFGENYLQEALDKIKQLQALPIEWHFIGAIQSNKTRELAENFSWVHSVDRLKIARRLSAQRPPSLAALNICLQINISQEDSKSGINLDQLDSLVDEISTLHGIKLRGLMAIPEKACGLNAQRAIFAKMQQAMNKYPQMDTLSMGMSADMEAAIAEGSTLLRIGTAIFGARNIT